MSAPLPKHVEIAESLIRRIGAGLIADGARLDPERAMAEALGVAVGTLRKALAILESQGLLERRQGSGNYIRHRPGVRSVYGLFRLELAAGGGLPTAQILSLDRLPRAPGVPGPEFGNSPGWRIRRLRRLDGIAVAVEEIWFLHPGEVAQARLSDSLYQSWRDLFGLRVTRVEDRVGLAPLPDWSPQPLSDLCGHVERRSWAAQEMIEFSWTWFDATRARFVSREGD